MAARLSALRIESDQVHELEAAFIDCRRHAETEDADGYYYANAEFHDVLYRASGNDYLTHQARLLKQQLQPYRRLQLRAPSRIRHSLSEHRVIADAIIAGKADAAEEAARNHVLVQVTEFNQLLRTWTRVRELGAGLSQPSE